MSGNFGLTGDGKVCSDPDVAVVDTATNQFAIRYGKRWALPLPWTPITTTSMCRNHRVGIKVFQP